jgi:hypothetical protein
MMKRFSTIGFLVAAAAHFPVQVAILWFAPWDYTPGQPIDLLAVAERWNWVGAVISFPLITFSVYFPLQFLEDFIGNFAPVAWIVFCVFDSLLWGVAVSLAVAFIARRRGHGEHNTASHGTLASSRP